MSGGSQPLRGPNHCSLLVFTPNRAELRCIMASLFSWIPYSAGNHFHGKTLQQPYGEAHVAGTEATCSQGACPSRRSVFQPQPRLRVTTF